MITTDYVRLMAAYNAEMNRRWYAAAATLSDAQRREDRGAFWGSLHGSLNHILWADRTWMSRLAGWEKPGTGMKDSAGMVEAFAELTARRGQTDADIIAWAGTLDDAWLAGNLTWFSGGAQRDMTQPRGVLVMHLFNHQTHHRGQAHCLLTQFGAATGGTDLPFLDL